MLCTSSIEVGCKTSLKLKEEWSCAMYVKFRGRVSEVIKVEGGVVVCYMRQV